MMQRLTRLPTLLAVTLTLAGLSAVADDIDEVAVRVWQVEETGSVPIPEMDDAELAVPWLQDRPSLGFAFSGGGTRSASASLGQYRSLHELGWLKRARYISANSGGSWITVPYTYLPLSIDEQRFFGNYIPPEALSDENLQPSEIDPLAFSTAIHDATTVDEVASLGRGDEAWSNIVGSLFLEPFGLHDNEKLFSFHRSAFESIKKDNPHLDEASFQFVEREDRPYMIVTGVVLAQQMSEDPNEYFPVEMTPLYTGVRARFEFEKDDEIVVVGGGYVESFGYDTYEPHGRTAHGRYQVQIAGMLSRGDNPFDDRYMFTLSDVIGTSSAAPLATLSRNYVPNVLFPEFRHWSVDQSAIQQAGDRVRRDADEFQHGDGADLDNLSITALLARQTENIITFVNTSTAFQRPVAGCSSVTDAHITDDAISLFRPNDRLIHNVVFDEGELNLELLCEELASRKESGEPLVYCQAYDVIRNDWHRIEPYSPNVCWVYLDRAGNWMDALIPEGNELVQDIHNREGSFDSFPHYSTFAEHGIGLIDLDRERVIALSNLAAWTVKTSASYIAANLPGAGLTAE